MKTVRRPPYPKWNPGYFLCSSLTPLPLSSRRPSVSFGGFGFKTNAERWFAVVGAAPIPPIIIVMEAFDLWGFPTLLFARIVGLALLPLDMLLLALIVRLRPQDFIQLRCQVCNLAVRPLVPVA